MRTIIKYLLFLLFSCIAYGSFGNSKADSLRLQLDTAKGIARFEILDNLTKEYRKNDPKKALEYAQKSFDYANEINYLKGKGGALSNLGLIKKDMGAFDEAEAKFLQARQIYSNSMDSSGLAGIFNNLGIIYQKRAFYEKALDHFYNALKIHERKNDKPGIASTLNNVAIIHVEQRRYTESLQYYFKILELCREMNEAFGEALIHNNIGVAYEKLYDFPNSATHFKQSYEMFKKINHLYGMGNALRGMGSILSKTGKYDEALEKLNKSLEIRIKLQELRGISQSHSSIGNVFLLQGKHSDAIENFQEALKYARKIGEKILLAEAYKGMYEAYQKSGNKVKAFDYLLEYAQVKDSVYDYENTENLARMQALYENSKKEKEIEVLNKERELKNIEISKKEAEIRYQNIQKIAFAGGCLLMLLLALFIYRGYSLKKKANEVISLQKSQVEQQKEIIEEKNKDITDSIHYAKRIQKAMLPTEKLMNDNLPEHFIFFQPKDIVSGDFYWANRFSDEKTREEFFLFAAADCTGHGVPGAFMSLIGTSFLNEIVIEKKTCRPDLVLNELRENIINALNQEGNLEEAKDGMDITLCSLDFKNNRLKYASAYNGLYLIHKNELNVYPADKFPVGKFSEKDNPFTLHELELHKGDCIYIFSDGYADQFGGPKGKKFKYSQLKELFLSIHHQPMEKQKEILNKKLVVWKGELDQVDDICIIGVKI